MISHPNMMQPPLTLYLVVTLGMFFFKVGQVARALFPEGCRAATPRRISGASLAGSPSRIRG